MSRSFCTEFSIVAPRQLHRIAVRQCTGKGIACLTAFLQVTSTSALLA